MSESMCDMSPLHLFPKHYNILQRYTVIERAAAPFETPSVWFQKFQVWVLKISTWSHWYPQVDRNYNFLFQQVIQKYRIFCFAQFINFSSLQYFTARLHKTMRGMMMPHFHFNDQALVRCKMRYWIHFVINLQRRASLQRQQSILIIL